MKEIVIRIIPADVYVDDFEDLLATDSLFVEYFNGFLQLPSFPEPLCFNKENGGFEVVSSAKKELAKEIKAAIRSGLRRKKIYRPVHSHSFRNIPLIPMEEPSDSGDKEIDTSFAVRTLNKEQGIQWVKRERLPLFLESDFYLEYRLAKLVSQVPAVGERGVSGSIKLDYTPHIRQIEEEEEEEEPPEDETEIMIRNLYASLGNAGTTDTEAWVSQAKLAMVTDTTISTTTRSTSAMAHTITRPVSARPVSARSIPGSARRLDSGIWSPNKTTSIYGGSIVDDMTQQYMFGATDDSDDIPLGGDLFDPNLKQNPITPRPSDEICSIITTKMGGVVYTKPHPPQKARVQTSPGVEPIDTEQEDQGIGDDSSISTETSIPSVKDIREGHEEPQVEFDFKDLDQLGSVIVASALKNAVVEVTGQSAAEVAHTLEHLRPMFEESEKFLGWDKDNTQCVIGDPSKKVVASGVPVKKGEMEAGEKAESVDGSAHTIIGDKDSDEDSVLNSDDDYEDDRDDFFRKTKGKTYNLSNVKGISAFKRFLMGSPGEKNWLFWMDIERAKFISDQTQLTNFLLAMRERYEKHGAAYELSKETKSQLGLTEPSHWTLDNLKNVQNAMTEPLILYWAPRFLMKQKVKIHPEHNVLYNQQKKLKLRPDPFPNPSVVSLLPLRPKTCLPRQNLQGVQTPRESLKISDALEGMATQGKEEPKTRPTTSENLLKTAPPVGMKRTYCLSDEFKTPAMKKEQEILSRAPPKLKQKTPRQLISPKLRMEGRNRPISAPVHFHKSKGHQSQREDPWDIHSSVSETSDAIRPASSRRSSTSTNSMESEYAGGRRMEGLLQALHNEKKSGGILRKFLNHVGNQLWKHSLDFWEELQGYHVLFYSEVLDPWMLKQKAKFLYSKYIVLGASKSIQCRTEIKDSIYYKLDPPFEELFDEAEEYVLSILYDAWSQMLSTDITTFSKVELIEVKRHLDAKSKYVMSLRRRGILKERVETPEDNMEGYEDPVYDEALWQKLPPEFQEWNLDKLVHNRLELEQFKNYLAENYASMDLMCWVDIEAFRRIPHVEEKRRDVKAKDIKVKYFTKKYFFGPNSPAGKAGQEKVMQAGGGWGKLLDDRPPTSSLLESQKYVRERLEKNWLPRFLATEEFQERQKPRVGMEDAVEDVLIQKKKKSQAIWRMIESKWVSSSKDIMTFRKALMNPVTSQQFRKFVSIKGDNFENDVLFYQEVQRYKDLCHIHSERSLVQQKTLAIINCFIDSPIPPALQIDITQETADKIVDRSKDATPYLFRESQMTVFRVLFSHWSDFCTFRSNLTQDKLVPTLDRHRRKAKADEKKRQKELEMRKTKLDIQRRAMGLPEGADIEEGFDPFENHSEDGVEERPDKQAVSWSYSQYLEGLDREDVLNHVDKQTFCSLTSKAPSQDGQSEMGDKLSVNKATDNTSRKSSARRSERSKLDAISEEGSQRADQKIKKSSQAKPPKDRTKRPSPPSSPPPNQVPAIKVEDTTADVKPPANGRCKANHSNSLKNGAGARITRKITK